MPTTTVSGTPARATCPPPSGLACAGQTPCPTLSCVGPGSPGTQDSDGDLIGDACDLCIDVFNPLQRDSNGDGFGNRCDADVAGGPNDDGDCVVGVPDLSRFARAVQGDPPYEEDLDLDGDGDVDDFDSELLVAQFGGPPGPSGVAQCGGP